MKVNIHLQIMLWLKMRAVLCGIYCSRNGVSSIVFLNMIVCSVTDYIPTLRMNILLPSSM
jgi:hypothetical protein